jgi:ribosomal protein S18 acetylase RimI-like enzyme
VPWRPRLAAAADLLAGGFFTDPLYTYMCPDEKARRDPGGKKAMLWALGSSYEMVDILEEEDGTLAAVALWEPGKPSCAGILRGTLGIAIPWWRSKGRLFSWAKLLFALEAKREELASDALHLMYIAANPTLKGKGRGSALLRRGLARADNLGVRCYLENTNEKNLPFYEKYGFRLVEEFMVDGGNGPTLYLMIRPAASASS